MNHVKKFISMNVFVVVTPFQQYVVNIIIQQYFSKEKNFIISTLKENSKISNASIINGRGIINILKIKKLIQNNIDNCNFYIPHVGTFYSAWIYSLSIKFTRPINIYYEGIALLYESRNNINTNKWIRYFAGKLLGFNYTAFEKLYPDELCNRIVNCYTPFLLDKYNNKCVLIKLDGISGFNDISSQVGNSLILTSNRYSDQFLNEIKEILSELNDEENVYIKFHYALPQNEEQLILKEIKSVWQGQLHMLDKMQPLESYLSTIHFNSIYSQDFSSALVNLYFMNYGNVEIRVINKKTIRKDIINLIGINIE